MVAKKIISPSSKNVTEDIVVDSGLEALPPQNVAATDSAGQYAAVEHTEELEDDGLDELTKLEKDGEFALNIKEKNSSSLHLSLTTAILLATLIFSVGGAMLIAFRSSDAASQDQQALSEVENVPIPEVAETFEEEPAVVTSFEEDLPAENSKRGDAQELLSAQFTVDESALLFFFNKQSTYNIEWSGDTAGQSYDFLHVIIDTSEDPDFFAETSITEVQGADDGSYQFMIPESFEGPVYARLCGFNSETRSCSVVSNILKIRES